MTTPIVDKSDLQIEEIPRADCASDGCPEKATHIITIDIRGAGLQQQIGGGLCLVCAQAELYRLRECFPPVPVPPSPVPPLPVKDETPF